jgi:RHS repeat-associated protein
MDRAPWLASRHDESYGLGFGATGSSQTDSGFTGKPLDSNGLLYLRARYYNPAAGVFTVLDPFEGIPDRAMSLNGYSWVEGNVPNATDASMMIYETPKAWYILEEAIPSFPKWEWLLST